MTTPANVSEIFRDYGGFQPPALCAQRIADLLRYWREVLPHQLLAAWLAVPLKAVIADHPEWYPRTMQALTAEISFRFVPVLNPPNRPPAWWLPYVPFLGGYIRGSATDPENLSRAKFLSVLCALLDEIRYGKGPDVETANRTMHNYDMWKRYDIWEEKGLRKLEGHYLTVYMPG
jgi:hypothetical protein